MIELLILTCHKTYGKFFLLCLPCPWLHILLNFIMDLPESDENMVILVVLYRFSCSLHFI